MLVGGSGCRDVRWFAIASCKAERLERVGEMCVPVGVCVQGRSGWLTISRGGMRREEAQGIAAFLNNGVSTTHSKAFYSRVD